MPTKKSAAIEEHFAEVTDPRRREGIYPLSNFLVIAVCAVICGADDFVAIAGLCDGLVGRFRYVVGIRQAGGDVLLEQLGQLVAVESKHGQIEFHGPYSFTVPRVRGLRKSIRVTSGGIELR